ncbi:Diacylglycerol kinase [hydrothermal vent metagenome]|uniref:Diacylglycerol kinase n=1 Tax=hydrothermal vent metagenome TaxID=652676 RepID=A0A3B0YUA9_9ZZZZ
MRDVIKTEVQRLQGAAGYSWAGLKAAYQGEAAFRLEVLLSVIIVPLAFIVSDSAFEQGLLIAVWAMVLIVELLNSAIEAAIDRISLDRHELSGRAKDMGSAAVFIAVVNAVIVWFFVLIN